MERGTKKPGERKGTRPLATHALPRRGQVSAMLTYQKKSFIISKPCLQHAAIARMLPTSTTAISSRSSSPRCKVCTTTAFLPPSPLHQTSNRRGSKSISPTSNPSPQPRVATRYRLVNASVTGLAAATVKTIAQNGLFIRVAQASLLNIPGYIVMQRVNQRILTAEGLRHALGLGIVLWATLGWNGYILCVSFLIIGSLLTRVGKARKEKLGIAEKRGGARGPENLWGAAGVSTICAILVALARSLQTGDGSNTLRLIEICLMMGYCGGIAAKTADTASSEIGKAYGGETYLITTLQKVPKGTEGAVSGQGTAAGLAAALVTALLAQWLNLIPSKIAYAIGVVSAGVFANMMESVIGATVQGRMQLSNEQVNLFNTLIGAIFSIVFCYFITPT